MTSIERDERAAGTRQTTHISLPVHLLRSAKARACLTGQTLAQYVAGLLHEDLHKAGMVVERAESENRAS